MRILIIRHGDPDYVNDTLTEKGHREASLLADMLEKERIDHAYVSPLGRARHTAEYTLKRKGMEGEICDWLKEFPCRIDRPDITHKKSVSWDFLPEDWTSVPEYYDKDEWFHTPTMTEGEVEKEYRYVTEGLDALLCRHGYRRDGRLYRAERSNEETVALFCHFGLECVLLSHLLGVSPMVLWHGFVAAPTSVTTIYTEERRRGIAYFRVASFGDISHLYAAGEKPSFAARFCETYDSVGQRKD